MRRSIAAIESWGRCVTKANDSSLSRLRQEGPLDGFLI
jgi:hypothetical protein